MEDEDEDTESASYLDLKPGTEFKVLAVNDSCLCIILPADGGHRPSGFPLFVGQRLTVKALVTRHRASTSMHSLRACTR